MSKICGTLDKWRDYFRTSNSGIFDIIEYAVMVAAVDCPKDFKLRRDRIAELLFTCKVTRCFGCEKIEPAVPNVEDEGICKTEFGSEFEGKKGRKEDNQIEMNVNQISNYSYGEAEALTDEIEEESQTVGEVLRIKEVIDNCRDESDSDIYECLRRLQLMALSVETLKATEIGKSVNALRKHSSNNIRHLSRTLIEDWKVMVDEWVNATAAFSESTPESAKASVVDDEEGLPSPPLDELAFFATQTTSIEFSQFFDGMDDDGNPRNSGELNKNLENGRKASSENNNPALKQQRAESGIAAPKNRKGEQPKKQEAVIKKQTAVVKPNKPFGGNSGPGRPIKPTIEWKLNNDDKLLQKPGKDTIQKRPVPTQQNKLKCSDEDAVNVKLEAAKRKLHERYREAEKAKRQRTIQVMELHDIPKQGLAKQGPGRKNPHITSGNHNRHWANGRR